MFLMAAQPSFGFLFTIWRQYFFCCLLKISFLPRPGRDLKVWWFSQRLTVRSMVLRVVSKSSASWGRGTPAFLAVTMATRSLSVRYFLNPRVVREFPLISVPNSRILDKNWLNGWRCKKEGGWEENALHGTRRENVGWGDRIFWPPFYQGGRQRSSSDSRPRGWHSFSIMSAARWQQRYAKEEENS